MPKIVPTPEWDALLQCIRGFPDGASLDMLRADPRNTVSARTLQRRLAELVAQGRVVPQREWRRVKYRLAPAGATLVATLVAPAATVTASGGPYVPLSPAGAAIKDYVRQPLQARRPVGYSTDFLNAYHPNATWYLPEKLRGQLHAMGRSPADAAPAGTFARDILGRLLIDLSWASSRLEGNTYSRLDTERLIQWGEVAEGKDALETQMILNHKQAIEYLVHDNQRVAVNADTVVALHALLSDGLLADPLACGRLRQTAVEIGGSVYRPLALPQSIEELFGHVLGMAAEIEDAFEQSFFLMVHLPYLQPFLDVNKRVSRLAANIPLVAANLSPLSFIDVPERAYVDAMLGVYELQQVDLLRDVFVHAYERSCQQYLAVRSQLVPPDTFRLRHRLALAEAVRAIVHSGHPATEAALRSRLPASVATEDQARFIQLVLEEFKALHAGNAVRFGVRPLELAAWLEITSK
jgi:fido (protein-threonine AMPylation protein)